MNSTRRPPAPDGLVTELPNGRSVLVKYFALPNGGSVATHEDCTEQRKLSRKLASTTQFLESVLDNVPVCVAAKNIEDGRYIFANRAFERFSRFSRDHIVGKRADEIFRADTAASIEAADQAALKAPEGYHRNEFVVERGDEKRVLASNRVVARNENNEPEFLIALFDDVTDRRSLSRELENTKKFLELVVDNIPVSLIVERVSDGRYLLANRSAETILNRRREDATGLTAADIFNPREAKLIIARDEAAIKKRGLLTEEHPISTKDGLRLFLTRRMTVLDDAGEPQYLIKTHEDVTDRRQTESRMAHMAYHDGLTDLPNRAAFLQALAQMIEACDGTDEEFAVLCIDLDGLKEVNDVFGHAMGDKVLIEVAQPAAGFRARRRGGAALRRRVRPDHRRQAAGRRHGAGRTGRARRWRRNSRSTASRSAPASPPASRYSRTTARTRPHCSPMPARRCSAPSRNRAARSASSSPRWTSRSAIAACCTRISRSRSRTANCRCTTSRRPPRARRSPPARSSASRRWRAGCIRCAASSRPAISFRSRKKAA